MCCGMFLSVCYHSMCKRSGRGASFKTALALDQIVSSSAAAELKPIFKDTHLMFAVYLKLPWHRLPV